MSSASRSALMTICRVSLSLLTTRSWSPWMRTCSFAETFWIRLRRSRAMSSVMPALSCTSTWPRPLPTIFGSPALNSFGDSCRRAAFSRRAWSSALVSSCASNCETTSNEYSATRVQDGLHADHDRRDGQRHADERADREQRADSRGGLVERLGRWLAERVGAVVEVVDARGARPGLELVEDRLAPGRDRLRAQRLERGLQVVARAAELGHDHVQRLRGGGRRVPAPEVGDDVVEGHWALFISDPARCRLGGRP